MVSGQRRWAAQFKDDRGNKRPTHSCIFIPSGASLGQGGHWQGRGRVRFVGAGSSGTASPHTPDCAASWSTDKLTHLEGSQNSGAAEIRTGKTIRHLMPSSLAQKNRLQAVLSLSSPLLKIPLQSVPATDLVFCCTKAFLNG